MSTNSSDDEKWSWLLDISQIQPGKSAILNNNTIIFYGVHYTAIFTTLLSLIACSAVMISLCRNNSKKRANWDFSDRFPLYLAIGDFIWGLIGLSMDNIVLVIRQTYPDKNVARILAINVFFFFGYQQLMSVGLSVYTYLKVVRRISLNLGRWEWKLHAIVISFLILNVSINTYLGAFGNAGFWFLADVNTYYGKLLKVNICVTCTIHAVITLAVYRSIQNVVKNQKRIVSSMHAPLPSSKPDWTTDKGAEKDSKDKTKVIWNDPGPLPRPNYYSTANSCLTTFIYISLCVYTPFAVIVWVYWIFGFFGYIEPITAFFLVILPNSGGCVNTWGYFYNRKLKEKRVTGLTNNVSTLNTLSSISNSSSV